MRAAVAAAVLAFMAAVAAAPAWGQEPGVTPLEQAAGAAVMDVAGKPVSVRCHDDASWAALAAVRGFPPESEGFALFGGSVAELAPRTCSALDDLWTGSPPACTRTVPYTVTVRRSEWVTVKRRVRVRVEGRLVWRTRRVRVKRVVTRRVERARIEPANCKLRSEHADAVWTLAHEAWHLTGIRDEVAAECYGMQRVAVVAGRLGVSATEEASLAGIAWERYQRYRVGTALWSAECRDGGALDLDPLSTPWP